MTVPIDPCDTDLSYKDLGYKDLVKGIPHFESLIIEKWPLLRLLSSTELAAALTSLESLAQSAERPAHEVGASIEKLWVSTRGIAMDPQTFLGFAHPAPALEAPLRPLVVQLDGDITPLWQPWFVYHRHSFLDLMPKLEQASQVVTLCRDGRRSLSALLFLKNLWTPTATTQSPKKRPVLFYVKGGFNAFIKTQTHP